MEEEEEDEVGVAALTREGVAIEFFVEEETNTTRGFIGSPPCRPLPR